MDIPAETLASLEPAWQALQTDFLDAVFEYSSTVDKDTYTEKVVESAFWALSAATLRKRVVDKVKEGQ